MKWRLGLDMGTNSLGWSVFELSEAGNVLNLQNSGVRILPDGREPSKNGRIGDSLAVTRRTARGMRRNRDRRISRKNELMDILVDYGLMPSDAAERKQLAKDNPYRLRAEAVSKKLEPSELGRALFNLGLRRGFKSNRKTGGGEDGDFYKKISTLQEELNGCTLGQYLWKKLQDGNPVRFRGEEGDFYPDRKMYEEEFGRIREVQGDILSDEQWDKIKDVIFFQRKLRPVEIGKCQFYTGEDRSHAGLPIAGEYRIVQEINNLAWLDDSLKSHFLTENQRQVLFEKLHEQKTLSWGGMRKIKHADGSPLFPKYSRFNYEDSTGRRKGFEGNKTHIDLDAMLGDRWQDMGESRQNDLVQMLYDAEDEQQIIRNAVQWELNADEAKQLAAYSLPSRTMSVSRKFMEDIIPVMMETGEKYDKAIKHLRNEYGQPLHHSVIEDGVLSEDGLLPYYGEALSGSMMGAHPEANDDNPEYKYGKIGNPTVHMVLNQLRRVVNALIEEYGPPEEIHIELSRDLKKARSDRDEISREIAANERENKRRAKICAEFGITEPSALDLKKIKLWEELSADQFARRCVFSGKPISAAMLLNGDAEIEHILPFSRTLDNSMANLTVSLRQANRLKKNSTPYEAKERFSGQGWQWEDICRRADSFPNSKRWRFTEDAMEIFEKDGSFIDRQLTDNAHIARISKRYLGKICDPNRIVCVNGQLTAMLRSKWGLNSILSDHNKKTRDDHRHHAIDAVVVGLTDRPMIQKISTARATDDRIRVQIPDLSTGLYDQIRDRINNIVVSYKPDHGIQGGFFSDTAYGFVSPKGLDKDKPDYNLVTTKPLDGLSKKEITAIRDKEIRGQIIEFVESELGTTLDSADDKKLKEALYKFGHAIWPMQKTKGKKGANSPDQRPPLKKVRILVANQSVKPISSAPYKGYAVPSYSCCDIYRIPKGKPGKWKKGEYEWKGIFRSYIEMKNPPENPEDLKPHPAAKLIMRVFKDDMVEVEENGQKTYMRVTGFSTTNNKLDLRPHTAANSGQNFKSINTLKDKIRKIRVSPHGKVA